MKLRWGAAAAAAVGVLLAGCAAAPANSATGGPGMSATATSAQGWASYAGPTPSDIDPGFTGRGTGTPVGPTTTPPPTTGVFSQTAPECAYQIPPACTPAAGPSTAETSSTAPTSPLTVSAAASSGAPESIVGAAGSPLDGQADRNKQAATAESARLASALTMPPGTAPGEASADVGLALGAPATSSLIDVTHWWLVPLGQKATLAWVAAHVPHGLSLAGSDGPVNNQPISGVSYGEAPTAQFEAAQLEVNTLAQSAASTLVRVDGTAEWLDPRPQLDTATVKRIAPTVAAGCPTSDGTFQGVNSPTAPTASLLPTAVPVSGLTCGFYGANGKPFQLYKSAKLDGKAAAATAAKINAVPLSHLDNAEHSCFSDDGSADIAVFHYSRGPDIAVRVQTGGCGDVSNGRILVANVSAQDLGLPGAPPES